jgi:hypothetical protein
MTILCRPTGSDTFFCANCLILFLTTSIPLIPAEPQTQSDQLLSTSNCGGTRVRGEGNAPLVRGVQLEHTLLVRVSQQRVRETVNTCRLSDTRHALIDRKKASDVSSCPGDLDEQSGRQAGATRIEQETGRTEMIK